MHRYALALTIAWSVATLAVGYEPLLEQLGDPAAPAWLAILLFCVDGCGAAAWWFWMGWLPLTRLVRQVAVAIGALTVGWGLCLLGTIAVTTQATQSWTGLDGPRIGYVITGILLPGFLAVPAAMAAEIGYLVRMNRPETTSR